MDSATTATAFTEEWSTFHPGVLLQPFYVVASLFYATLNFTTVLVYRILAWLTIALPTLIYSILSRTITFTFHFKTLLLGIGILCAAGYWLVRYRLLTVYSRLPKPTTAQHRANEAFDLQPDAFLDDDLADGDDGVSPKPGGFPQDFLSVFLSSIQIFGYLEQPVFHEITRHLQTRRLLAGETMFQDEQQDRSFYIVIDGSVQVYLKPEPSRRGPAADLVGRNYSSTTASDRQHRPHHNHRRGSDRPRSSRRSAHGQSVDAGIMQPTRSDLDFSPTPTPARNQAGHSGASSPELVDPPLPPGSSTSVDDNDPRGWKGISGGEDDSDCSAVSSDWDSSDDHGEAEVDPFEGLQLLTEVKAGQILSSLFTILSLLTDNVPLRYHRKCPNSCPAANQPPHPPASGDDHPPSPEVASSSTTLFHCHRHVRPRADQDRAFHPDVVARASEDTTLAVIPVEAFHKLNKKFPNASAHITQVILTRLQRATLMIIGHYLGAHRELDDLDRAVMQLSHYPVPPPLTEALSLPHLRAHFLQAKLSSDLIPGDTFARNSKVSPHVRRAAPPHLRQRPGRGSHFLAPEDGNDSLAMDLDTQVAAANLRFMPDQAGLSGLFTPTTTTVRAEKGEFPFRSNDGSPFAEPLNPAPKSSGSQRHRGNSKAQAQADDHDHGNQSAAADEECPVFLQPENFGGNGDFTAVRDMVFECICFNLGLPFVRPRSSDSVSMKSNPSTPRSRMTSPLAATTPAGATTTMPRSQPRRLFADVPASLGGGGGGSSSSGYEPMGGLHSSSLLDDLDTASIHTNVSSVHSFMPSPSVDIDNDVELMYLPRGSHLIKRNEHPPGLFFVIDGILYAHRDALASSPSKTTGTGRANARHRVPSDTSQRTPWVSTTPATSDWPHSSVGNGNWASANRTTGALSSGRLRKSSGPGSADPPALFFIKPGGLAGYLGAISDYPSIVHISAFTDTVVGFLPKKALDRMLDRYPIVLLTLAKRLVSRLSPLVLYVDYAIEWGQANPGQIVYREGVPADSVHAVLNGRLRAIHNKPKPDSGFDILAEFGQGQSIGELEVLADLPRRFTLHAIRATEYVRLPKTLFNALASRHPEITFQISRMLALRTNQVVQNQWSRPGLLSSPAPLSSTTTSTINFDRSPMLTMGKNNMNLKTIGILPIHRTVPVTEFAMHLRDALLNIGTSTALLNNTTVGTVLGRRAFSRMGKLKFMSWLAEQEQKYQLVLYVADGGVRSSWTQQCIRQADCILLVGLGEGDPSIGDYERLLVSMKTTARKELVLLHEKRYCAKGTTQRWLKNRLWIHAHHHVQMPQLSSPAHFMQAHIRAMAGGTGGLGGMLTAATIVGGGPNYPFYPGGVDLKSALITIKGRFKKYYSRFIPETPPTPSAYLGHRSDFSRLARRLCGQSVGLVLGGGGARGIAHIGVIRAIEEAGIPIDMVGGTSIGAFVAGLYARDSDTWAILGWARMFSARMGSIWRQILDVTYPVTSYVTGHEFNRSIWKVFGDHQIEDLWLPYFCITANITFSREEVHQTGYLWRYVRASMSLSGFLPPLCDNGNMLLDGGYLDNLPVQVMQSLGARTIFAVDVAADDDTSPLEFGDAVSGWRILINRWNPFVRTKIPNLAEIQSRLAYVSSVKLLEAAKATPGCIYVKPPVQPFGVLQFGSFEEILQVGYLYGKECVKEWERSGLLDQWQRMAQPKAVRSRHVRRNSL
ncbi:phosphatidylcholine and lysophosphatidylcholine phospholipase [Dimargaris cristalligena]|nr:phosphatidylcholine and lysophosphatidylcholine phospholipase [Dimargaris cristalligena]